MNRYDELLLHMHMQQKFALGKGRFIESSVFLLDLLTAMDLGATASRRRVRHRQSPFRLRGHHHQSGVGHRFYRLSKP